MNAIEHTRREVDVDPARCGREYCSRAVGVELVEIAGELRRLCRACRKDLWRTSS